VNPRGPAAAALLFIGIVAAGAASGAQATYRATFTETRTLPSMKKPLVLHGDITFKPGKKLVWAIERPYKYRLIVQDGRIEEHLPGGGVNTGALSKTPWAAALFDLFSALFGGDEGALARYFHVNPTAQGFTLVPRSEVLARSVQRIAVTGKPLPATVTIEEANGSRTRLAFKATSPLPPVPATAAATSGG